MNPRVAAVVTFLTLLAIPRFAAAQDPVSPRADVSVGVAHFREDGHSINGLHLTGSIRPWRYVGFVGDFTDYRHRNTLMGGVRAQATGRIAPFVQFLMGSAPLDDIALQPGGGVDVRIGERLAARVGVDVKIAGDDGRSYIAPRVTVGGVILLGRR